ncbi:YgaP family membrane protein [Spongiimicrobium salis]|uniref:YgaP family membrane protein n=1 Tax=Spongiimicrobium salis TaxID=1667022 RepID=UPI00374D70E4
MKKNMGGTDRIVRIILALIVITLYFTNVISGTLAYVLLTLSGVFVLTSFMSFCPLYSIFGLNTCKVKE